MYEEFFQGWVKFKNPAYIGAMGDAIFSTKKTPYHFLHFQNTKISTLMPQRSKMPKSPLFQNTIFSTYFLPFYRNLHSFRFQIKYFLTSLYYWKIISTIAYIVVYDYWQIVISIYQGTSGLMKKLRDGIQNENGNIYSNQQRFYQRSFHRFYSIFR